MRIHLMVAFTEDNGFTFVMEANDAAEVMRILRYADGPHPKITAIKYLRSKHGTSLQDSKTMVETIESSGLFVSEKPKKGVDA